MTASCGCTPNRARTVVDAEQHAAWHALMLVQLGVPYEGDPLLARSVRGQGTWTELGETLIDRRKRNGGRRT